jgi:GT2 family glycosyltransferase
MNQGLVSVVIPTFNGQQYLGDTLRSVLAQTYPVVEIIVVDDGSGDRTEEVMRTVAPAARWLCQPNAGVSSARNRGLAAAHGSYVIFLDQDDIWHPQQLERQVAWLSQHPQCGVVVCPYQHWRPQGGVFAAPSALWPQGTPLDVDPDFSGWVYHQFLFDCWALTSGTLMRCEAVQACGGFDTTLPYSEDWDLWLRLSRQVPFALLRWPSVLYRHHATQGSRTVRVRDYRTELLLRHAQTHGLASADGRAMSALRFKQRVAQYRAEFGYHHLMYGQRWTGVQALAQAWFRQPQRIRWLMQAAAGGLGWRPYPGP